MSAEAYEPQLCTCGKRRYRSRAEARRAVRQLRSRGRSDRPRAYECAPGIWHLGHKPATVRNGTLDTDDYVDGYIIATQRGKCMLCFRALEIGQVIHPNHGYPFHKECPLPL